MRGSNANPSRLPSNRTPLVPIVISPLSKKEKNFRLAQCLGGGKKMSNFVFLCENQQIYRWILILKKMCANLKIWEQTKSRPLARDRLLFAKKKKNPDRSLKWQQPHLPNASRQQFQSINYKHFKPRGNPARKERAQLWAASAVCLLPVTMGGAAGRRTGPACFCSELGVVAKGPAFFYFFYRSFTQSRFSPLVLHQLCRDSCCKMK